MYRQVASYLQLHVTRFKNIAQTILHILYAEQGTLHLASKLIQKTKSNSCTSCKVTVINYHPRQPQKENTVTSSWKYAKYFQKITWKWIWMHLCCCEYICTNAHYMIMQMELHETMAVRPHKPGLSCGQPAIMETKWPLNAPQLDGDVQKYTTSKCICLAITSSIEKIFPFPSIQEKLPLQKTGDLCRSFRLAHVLNRREPKMAHITTHVPHKDRISTAHNTFQGY